jgi:hypothetical protein
MTPDRRVRELMAEIRTLTGTTERDPGLRFSDDLAHSLKARAFDLPRLRELGYRYEALDQNTAEVIMGVE